MNTDFLKKGMAVDTRYAPIRGFLLKNALKMDAPTSRKADYFAHIFRLFHRSHVPVFCQEHR
jgi:hypothetical protein